MAKTNEIAKVESASLQPLENIEKNILALNASKVDTDKKFEEVFRRLDEGTATPKEAIFFEGQFFEVCLLLEKMQKFL